MHTFFYPATRLMSRLRFSMKFAVSGLVAFALLIYFGIAQVQTISDRIEAIRSERAAAALMSRLVEWNKVLIDSRYIAITATAGDESVRPRFKQQADVVEKKLVQIEQEVAADKAYFDLSASARAMREGWQELQKKVDALPVDKEFPQKAFAAHGPEYGRLYAFMRELGDKSGMVLEPEYDLFYLGYPLANNTPSTAGIAVRFSAYTTLNIARGTLTPADKVFYEVTEARLRDTFGSVETMLTQSMKSNPMVEARLSKNFTDLKASSSEYLAFLRKNFTTADAITVTPEQAVNASKATIDSAWALVEQNRVLFDELLVQRSAAASFKRTILAALLAIAILLSLYLYVGMYLSIRASLLKTAKSVRAIAAGELGSVADERAHDEFGDLMNDLRRADQSLVAMVEQVRQNANAVATASAEIAEGNIDLSARTEQQASALEQTAASAEQLGATVKQNAESAQQASKLAMTASQVAADGGSAVVRVVETMKSISESSRKIADIIGVIDGIAFQTNILALNAAVEAARAGDQGKGFAVVATEVRSLAGRSAQAAKEIKTLIVDSVERVQTGTRQVDEAGATMTEVVGSIKRVNDIMSEISAASAEQSASVAQVGIAITQIDQATQQNSALVEEMAAAAGGLKSQANELVETVAVFKLAA